MEILLNNEKLEFTLENEKSLGDVIRGIENWISLSDHIITSLKLGEKDLFLEPLESWHSIPVKEIHSLQVTTKPSNELFLNNMETVINYCSLLKKCLAEKDKNQLSELSSGYPFMIQSLDLISKNFPQDEFINLTAEVKNLFNGLPPDMLSRWNDEQFRKGNEYLEGIIDFITLELEKSQDPYRAFANIVSKIKSSLKNITEVSIQLQTGKDKMAMETISAFSDNLQELLPVLIKLEKAGAIDLKEWKISDVPFNEFYNGLNLILNQLVEAFNNNDYVLIGDLMEYEIAPKLNEFILSYESNFVNKVKEGS
ncbi:MAG: hypothetical protein JW969_05270 [Spirochaetales bacterium]|nr:hypothetical protein [Spirochaetales bacterium]